MSTKLTRLYKKKLGQSKSLYPREFTPEEEQELRKQVQRWPQETRVLTDFMLERGVEPMVEPPDRSLDITGDIVKEVFWSTDNRFLVVEMVSGILMREWSNGALQVRLPDGYLLEAEEFTDDLSSQLHDLIEYVYNNAYDLGVEDPTHHVQPRELGEFFVSGGAFNDMSVTSDVNIVDENDGLEDTKELSLENTHPGGEGDDSQNTRPGLGPLRIEGVSKNSGMIAIYPSDYAAEEIHNHFKRVPSLENKKDLHVTLVYLGKDLTDEQWQIVEDVCDLVADVHDGMWCKTQGVGVFDHDNDGRPFYCSVDAVGLAAMRTDLVEELSKRGIEVPSEYDFTPHMTIAYLADLEKVDLDKGSPNVKWECNEICLVRGNETIHTSELSGMLKEAGGFGFNLLELATPSKGDGGYQQDAPLSENTQEDPDLKLGDVEAPYSMSYGPLGVRFDDGLDVEKEYNIEKGAASKPLYPREFTPEQEQDIRKEVGKWPQETLVMQDFMLERGHEPMVEEDVRPPIKDISLGYPIQPPSIQPDGPHEEQIEWLKQERNDVLNQEDLIRDKFNTSILAAVQSAIKQASSGDEATVIDLDSISGLGEFLVRRNVEFRLRYVPADFENPEGEWQVMMDLEQGGEGEVIHGVEGRLRMRDAYAITDGITSNLAWVAQLYHDRFEDFNIPDEKEAVGLADNQLNENHSGTDYDRLDKSIPRDPAKEGPLYGR